MKSGAKRVACVVGGLMVCLTTQGAPDVPDLPYQEIITRNVFGLKPPPPPPSPEETNPPPSKITLTGITSIPSKIAFMKTPAPPPKPGEKASGERFYALHVGERDGEIEVVDIDEKAGKVKVKNAGQEELLDFEKNGVKLAATPLPTTPGLPGALPGVRQSPTAGFVQPVLQPGQAPATLPAFPSRTIRSGTPTPGGAAMPSFGSVAPSYTPVPAQQRQVQFTPEETSIIVEAQRQQLINKGSPNAIIMPPTALSPNPTPPGGAPNPMPQ